MRVPANRRFGRSYHLEVRLRESQTNNDAPISGLHCRMVGLSSMVGSSSRAAHQDSIREAVDLKSMEWTMEEAWHSRSEVCIG